MVAKNKKELEKIVLKFIEDNKETCLELHTGKIKILINSHDLEELKIRRKIIEKVDQNRISGANNSFKISKIIYNAWKIY